MRRGGPYLSARVDKVRGNNTEAAHCSSSHTLRPPAQERDRRRAEVLLATVARPAGAGGDQKCGSRDRIGGTVRILPCGSSQQISCYFARKESSPWSGLICYAWSCGTCLLCSALLQELYGREIMFSALPPTFSLYNCALCLSPLPPGRGGRRDHCLNTSPVKQDLVFDTRLQGDRPAEGKGMTRIGGLHDDRIRFTTCSTLK